MTSFKAVRSVAEALVKHECSLSLDGLTTVMPEALKILRTNPDIELPSEFDEKPLANAGLPIAARWGRMAATGFD